MGKVRIITDAEFWADSRCETEPVENVSRFEHAVSTRIEKALFPDSDLSPYDPDHVEIRYPRIHIRQRVYTMSDQLRQWWSLYHKRVWEEEYADVEVPSITLVFDGLTINTAENLNFVPENQDIHATFTIKLKNPKLLSGYNPKTLEVIQKQLQQALDRIAKWDECITKHESYGIAIKEETHARPSEV